MTYEKRRSVGPTNTVAHGLGGEWRGTCAVEADLDEMALRVASQAREEVKCEADLLERGEVHTENALARRAHDDHLPGAILRPAEPEEAWHRMLECRELWRGAGERDGRPASKADRKSVV